MREHRCEVGLVLGPDRSRLEEEDDFGLEIRQAVVRADDTVDLRQVLRRSAQFFRDESCGQCVPCRVGTVRQEELLARLAARRHAGTLQDELALLRDLGQVMRDASICGLGQTASTAIESALRMPGLVSFA